MTTFPSVFISGFRRKKALTIHLLLFVAENYIYHTSDTAWDVVSRITCGLLFHCCGIFNTGISFLLISFSIEFFNLLISGGPIP